MAWPDDTFTVLRALGVRQVAYVPDAGHATLIERCRAEGTMQAVPLTTEEEGVALLAGAWLGGERGVLLLQSSGVGNCINMLAMTLECRFPLLMLVTMRGEWAEFNPWQVPMGQATAPVLRQLGIIVERAEVESEVAARVEATAHLAFDTGRPAAVLISQRVVGRKRWSEPK